MEAFRNTVPLIDWGSAASVVGVNWHLSDLIEPRPTALTTFDMHVHPMPTVYILRLRSVLTGRKR